MQRPSPKIYEEEYGYWNQLKFMQRVALTTSLGRLMDWCMKQAATDPHAQADRRYSFRVDGQLRRIAPKQFAIPTNEDILNYASPKPGILKPGPGE